ncbi:hypothetical protein IFM89_001526 [Coptis chinensis]|uniref:ATP-dependent DNA ligase family profile domain-containing protein n=1 Tax=Coptis chinensis TaxID=261450 RepID=A0A835HVN1_9MAGN|nr:hypothetical protein IFM89_001526 [Coptis chinensis]
MCTQFSVTFICETKPAKLISELKWFIWARGLNCKGIPGSGYSDPRYASAPLLCIVTSLEATMSSAKANVVLMAAARAQACNNHHPILIHHHPRDQRKIGQGIIQLEKNLADFDTNSAAFWNEVESVLFFVSCLGFRFGVELGIGESDLIKAVAKTYKISEKHIKEELGIRQATVYSENRPPAQLHFKSSPEEVAEIVKKVCSEFPNFDRIIPALLESGVLKLSESCRFTPCVLIGSILSKPTKGISQILDNKFQAGTKFTCEYKYDDEHAQIQKDGYVEIYSRNGERNTGKFPDVVNSVKRLKNPSIRSSVCCCLRCEEAENYACSYPHI